MKVFLYGFALFILSIIIQLVVSRIRLPKRQMTFLFKIFLVVLLVGLFCNYLLELSCLIAAYQAMSISEVLHVVLFYISMFLAYLLAYSAVEADSPSLLITMTIYRAGPDGIDEEQLMRTLDMDRFFESRVTRLVDDKMIEESNGRYRVAPKGRLAMNIIVGYRRLMGGSSELG